MITFLTVLILIVCVLLILIVLIQNSKGGGLAGSLAGNAQVMGVRKTTDFLEKATWTLAIALVILSLLVNIISSSGPAVSTQDTELREKINKGAPAPTNVPGNPVPGGQSPAPAPAPAPAQ